MNNSTISNIKKIICNFYCLDDIIQAKKILWNLCESNLEPYSERKNTDKRSSSEAHTQDILDAMTKMDSLNQLPVFVAKNLDQLPIGQPEDLNIISIINRLSKIEDKQNEVDNLLIKHDDDIKLMNLEVGYDKVTNHINHINDKIDRQNNNILLIQNENTTTKEEFQKICDNLVMKVNEINNKYQSFQNLGNNKSYSEKTSVTSNNNNINNNGRCCDELDVDINDEVFEKFLDTCAGQKMTSLSITDFNTNHKNGKNIDDLLNENINYNVENNDEDETKITSYNEESNSYESYSQAAKKSPKFSPYKKKITQMDPIVIHNESPEKIKSKYVEDEEGFLTKRKRISKSRGNNNDDCITGASPILCTLWINKIDQGNCNSIKTYLNNRNIRVKNVQRTSHIDSKYKSFSICILREDMNKVLNNRFWPEGVNCRIWRNKNNNIIKSRIYSSSLYTGRSKFFL